MKVGFDRTFLGFIEQISVDLLQLGVILEAIRLHCLFLIVFFIYPPQKSASFWTSFGGVTQVERPRFF